MFSPLKTWLTARAKAAIPAPAQPAQAGDDEPAPRSGWYESSRELLGGLDVAELAWDDTLPAWRRAS